MDRLGRGRPRRQGWKGRLRRFCAAEPGPKRELPKPIGRCRMPRVGPTSTSAGSELPALFESTYGLTGVRPQKNTRISKGMEYTLSAGQVQEHEDGQDSQCDVDHTLPGRGRQLLTGSR